MSTVGNTQMDMTTRRPSHAFSSSRVSWVHWSYLRPDCLCLCDAYRFVSSTTSCRMLSGRNSCRKSLSAVMASIGVVGPGWVPMKSCRRTARKGIPCNDVVALLVSLANGRSFFKVAAIKVRKWDVTVVVAAFLIQVKCGGVIVYISLDEPGITVSLTCESLAFLNLNASWYSVYIYIYIPIPLSYCRAIG